MGGHMISTSDFGFITFNREDIPKIITSFNMNFNERGYLERKGETVECYACKKAITKDRIGHILPGSEIVCCANPLCFARYVDDYLVD
jgi:hypothetical protein